MLISTKSSLFLKHSRYFSDCVVKWQYVHLMLDLVSENMTLVSRISVVQWSALVPIPVYITTPLHQTFPEFSRSSISGFNRNQLIWTKYIIVNCKVKVWSHPYILKYNLIAVIAGYIKDCTQLQRFSSFCSSRKEHKSKEGQNEYVSSVITD